MAVPKTGNFNMFNINDDETIQGAIKQGGGNVVNANNFIELKNASNPSLFDSVYSGAVNNVNDITNSLQYRNYPKSTPISLCYGISGNDVCCSCTGNTVVSTAITLCFGVSGEDVCCNC